MLEIVGISGRQQALAGSVAPHDRELGSWRYFYRANDPQLADILRNPEVWNPACFDGDSSL
jgi:hypothetical protein